MAHIIAIEQEGMFAIGVQLFLHRIGNGRFARTRQPVNHKIFCFGLSMQRAARNNINRCRQYYGRGWAKMEHAGGHRGIGYFINQHKTAEFLVVA